MFRIILVLIFSLLLMGCETVLNKEQISKKYPHATLSDFITERYIDNIHKFIVSAGEKIAPHAEKTLADYSNQILSDGKSIIYPAYFNEMNDKLLYKPRKELEAFCELNQGRFVIDRHYKGFINGLYENPTIDYFESLNSNLPKTISITGLLGETIKYDVDKKEVAKFAAMGTIEANERLISKQYRIAANNGAFGLFSCKSNINDRFLWKIIIKPIAFRSADPSNQLTANVLYMLLVPEQSNLKQNI